MNDKLVNDDIIVLTKEELAQACRDSYQNGFQDGQRMLKRSIEQEMDRQFNYKTITYQNLSNLETFKDTIKY